MSLICAFINVSCVAIEPGPYVTSLEMFPRLVMSKWFSPSFSINYLCLEIICFLTSSGPEMQILDYVTQQYKLLPQIANSYALKMASRFMMQLYVTTKGEIQEGDLSSLPVVSQPSAVELSTLVAFGQNLHIISRL